VEEVERYMNHRLGAAGRVGAPLFTMAAVRLIAELSEGIPRNISNICFNAMSIGCAMRAKTIDVAIVHQVAADFDLTNLRSEPGVTSFRPESISLADAMSDARSLAAGRTSTPINVRRGEALSSKEAVAYLQEIVQRLKSSQNFPN
jgi:hypothetical protein